MDLVLREKGAKYTEQNLRLKLDLFKEKTLTIPNICAIESNEDDDCKVNRPIGQMKKDLSFNQDSFQNWVDLHREYPGLRIDLNYDEIVHIEDSIDREESLKRYLRPDDPASVDLHNWQYRDIVHELKQKFKTKYDAINPNGNADEESFKFDNMPKIVTHLLIGKGSYGNAVLFTKADRNERFNLESEESQALPNRYYVMKRIKKMPNNNTKNHMKNEAYLSVWMRHPNVVEVLGCYDSVDNRFYVMEFLPFSNVLDIFKRIPFTFDDISFIVAQLVMALEYVNDIGFIFNDLHPGNICMDYKGYIKLIDFGLAIPKNEPGCLTYFNIANMNPKNLCLTHADYRYGYDVHRLALHVFQLNTMMTTSNPTATAGKIGPSGTSVTIDDTNNFILNHLYLPDDVDKLLPTMRESKKHSLFKNIDFKRLLLRGYDMSTEYSTSLAELFSLTHHQYFNTNRQNTLRGNETRFNRYRKLDDPTFMDRFKGYELPPDLNAE